MNALVRGLALRRLRLEPGRSALLVIGVALGCAVFVAVRALNKSAMESLGKVSEVAAGEAPLVVDGGAGGVPRDLAAKIGAIPGVRAATPVIARFAREAESDKGGDQAGPSTRRLLVLGAELGSKSGNASAASVKVNGALLALSPYDSAIVSEEFAKRRGLKEKKRFTLFLSQGRKSFQVVGTFKPTGPAAEAVGGDVIVLTLDAAAKAFGTPGRVDRISVYLQKDADLEQVKKAAQSVAGQGFTVGPPASTDQRSALLGPMQLGLEIASLLALIIGQFLIYNSMSIAVVRRRPEIGVLRAIGTTKVQLAILLLAESAAFGVVGAAGGLLLGTLLAQAAIGVVNAQVSQLYVALDVRTVTLGATTIIAGLIAGPVATVLATIPPVYQALTVSPVEAARKDVPRKDPHRAIRLIALLGLAILLACGVVVVTFPGEMFGLLLGSLLQVGLCAGAALLAPWGVAFVVRCVRPLLATFLGPTGALAGDNLLTRPGRAGVTVAALMVALGGVLAISGLVSSLEVAIRSWVEQIAVADLYSAASTPLGSQTNTLLAAEVADEMRAVPGVSEVFPVRFVFEQAEARKGSGLDESSPCMLIAIDLKFMAGRAHVPVVEAAPGGFDAAMQKVMTGGEGVAVSSNFARRRGLRVGDRITLRTPEGPWSPEVLVIVLDYTSEHGCIYVHRPIYERRWGDTRANAFDLFLEKHGDPEAVRLVADDLRGRFGAKYDLFFTEQQGFRNRIQSVVDSAFTVTYAMQIVAIGVALLGVVTTLYAAILERTREVGILRAVGASRGQIWRAVVTEAFLLGALASGFACTTGWVLGLALVHRIIAGAYGWELAYQFPLERAAIGVVAATLLATIAGALPAGRAARIKIVEALAYE